MINEAFWGFDNYNGNKKEFNVIAVGATNCKKGYCIENECSEFVCIEYITDGTGFLEIDGKKYLQHKGNTVLIPRHSKCKYYTDPVNLQSKIWMMVSGDIVDQLFKNFIPEKNYVFESAGIKTYFDEVLRLTEKYTGNYNMMCRRLFVQISNIFTHVNIDNPCASSDLPTLIRDHLDAGIYKKYSLTELSASLNYSKNHLIYVFRKEYGITPYRYLLIKKIENAKWYLENTGISVSEISNSLKFADTAYFSNIFRKETGMTPTEYRKQKR